MRCPLRNRAGLRCILAAGHAGLHVPDETVLDDPSEEILERQERRDREEKDEEAL